MGCVHTFQEERNTTRCVYGNGYTPGRYWDHASFRIRHGVTRHRYVFSTAQLKRLRKTPLMVAVVPYHGQE